MGEPRLTLVAARGRNGVIGAGGAIPWRASVDMKRFKALTLGKPVIMGRKTWDSLGRPLPRRRNIVLTRAATLQAPGAWVFPEWAVAKAAARAMALAESADDICVIGGAEIYALALPEAHRLALSEVEAAPAGDAVFPPFDEGDWREVERVSVPPEAGEVGHVFRLLERVTGSTSPGPRGS